MQFGDKEKKILGYFIMVVAILAASYLGAYNGAPALPPLPDFGAESVPTQPGPPGDFVSMTQGGTYQDAIAVSVPTANATADTGLLVNNLSVAQPFSMQDAGTPVLEGYNGGGISIYAPTAVATGVPALKVNNAGVSNPLEVQDGGTSALSVYNGGGVAIAAPTAVGTAVPALKINNAGVSNPLEVQDGGVAELQVLNGGGLVVAAPTAIGTAVPAMRVDSSGGLSNLLEVRDSATPVFTVHDGGAVTGKVLRYATAGTQIVCGSTTITGTGTLAHGLTTPAYCMTGLKGDFAADTGFTSCAISGSTVTGKVWKINATPTAGDAGVLVAWCVIGAP